MYEEIQSEVKNTSRFDENLDLSMTYIGRMDKTRASKSRQRKNSLYHNKGIQ